MVAISTMVAFCTDIAHNHSDVGVITVHHIKGCLEVLGFSGLVCTFRINHPLNVEAIAYVWK